MRRIEFYYSQSKEHENDAFIVGLLVSPSEVAKNAFIEAAIPYLVSQRTMQHL